MHDRSASSGNPPLPRGRDLEGTSVAVARVEDAGGARERHGQMAGGGGSGETGPVIHVDGLTLDLERRYVWDRDSEAALSKREFALLLHLVRRPGSVSSRRQLLAAVWDTPFDPGTNVVAVCVRRLRSKLSDGRIETLRNVGYSLRLTDRTPLFAAPAGIATHEIG